MNRVQQIRLVAVFFGLLFPFVDCRPAPEKKGPVEEFDIIILTDAKSIQTRLGEVLTGYLAEYESFSQKRRIFISLELLRYGKGERLTVRGRFVDDTVRMSYGDQGDADFPVFYILRAGPSAAEKKLSLLSLAI